MRLIKRYRVQHSNGCYCYYEKEMTNVIICKRDGGHFEATDCFKTIKIRPVNGRYMIKKQSLKYILGGFTLLAYRKTYFVYADGGICFTTDKKRIDVFYTNNWSVACRLAKSLAYSSSELVSIVDRKQNGMETYVLNKTQQKNSNKIIVK